MCLPQCDQTNVAMLAKEKINNQIFKLNEIAKFVYYCPIKSSLKSSANNSKFEKYTENYSFCMYLYWNERSFL